ncbi:MAG: hypothetical protein CVV41_17305 [Candidatus Riflebacteria bacterium HGW-Riflebacteria-1]|jgi:hypothetical protein|nr:MAG: hypothetical protein CVV41_17305 [Candidatus Riflebacteria bacterium HGW-Riflebacteria-1]
MNKLGLVVTCLILCLSCSLNTTSFAASGVTSQNPGAAASWQPTKTIALLTGVLTWQDTSLATYTAENRYDQQFYNILRQRGVPKDNIVFLKDKKATLAAINKSLQQLLARSNADSTFLFYYTGHGDNSEDGSETYFLNYDCDTQNFDATSLKLSTLAETIKQGFKGKRAILTADCCYSGNLNRVAEILGKAGIETIVLSSSTAANESTGEWTFTRSLNEILTGTPLMQCDELELTAASAADYIAYNMACAEMQLANYRLTPGFPAKFVLTKLGASIGKNKPHLGKYMIYREDGVDYKVRIVDQKDKKCRIHFPELEDEPDIWCDYSKLKNIAWKTWNVGSKIKVKWEKKWYPAQVLKREGFFHYIRYDDHEDVWNEWVAFDRIKDISDPQAED